MKIGLLSDTHKKIGRAKKVIDLLIEKEVDYLIHAGDIGKLEILEFLRDSNISYVAVIGNNDYHLVDYSHKFNLVREPHYFKLKDLKFKLMHHPFYLTPDVDVVVYGHTHFSEFDLKNDTLFLNAGEVCARDTGKSEFMILEILEDKYIIDYYNRIIKSKNWNIKRIEYKKNL